MLSGIKFVPKDELQKDDDSDSEELTHNKKKDSKRRKEKKKGKRRSDSSDSDSDSYEEKRKKKKGKRGYNSSDSDSYEEKRKKKDKKKKKKRSFSDDSSGDSEEEKDMAEEKSKNEVVRREMGLEWMLQSANKTEKNQHKKGMEEENKNQDTHTDEVEKTNPKELNPYLKDGGAGYPDEEKTKKESHVASSVIGDGGASWRLKALKRAKEQAAREGRKLDEVVGERFSSLGDLAASISTTRAAPTHAHLHAIRSRKSGQSENSEGNPRKNENRDYLRDVSSRHPEMRKPRQDSSLKWRRNEGQNSNLSSENKALVAEAVSEINKFDNDGSFLDKIRNLDSKKRGEIEIGTEIGTGTGTGGTREANVVGTEGMSKNQLAAKILQLKMKGKHEEAEQLSKQMEAMVENSNSDSAVSRVHSSRQSTSIKQSPSERKRREEDSDLFLAKTITQNKKYSMSSNVDDEYEYDGNPPSRKKNKRKEEASERGNMGRRPMMTQQERCLLCFENPSRPKHLVVSIANFTYLMIPQRQPVVEGHCIILPLQHEAATRNVDDNVWGEIRNFKKCLIQMFAKEEKEVIFLETVIDISKQKRHCLVECIPIPFSLSNAAPMYFKKAIDEVEDEWEQHGAKKLIPTSGNLRQAIPENFPYFHVEFGLDRGFVHVIDDEAKFGSGFGLNVIRGMLELPEEDMHRKRRYESVEKQKEAVRIFAKDWEPFDWTRQL